MSEVGSLAPSSISIGAVETSGGGASTKDAYLRRACAIAAQIAATTEAASPFCHVSLGAVAAAAGVARSTLYRLWPSQREFWDELLAFVFTPAPDARTPTHGGAAEPPAPVRPDAPVHDAVQSLLLTDREALIELGIVGQPAPTTTRDLVAARRAMRVAALTAALEEALRGRDETVLGGLTTTDVAVALMVVGTGMPVTGRLVPPDLLTFQSVAFDGPSDAGRCLFGVLQVAIRDALTGPGVLPPSVDMARPARPGPRVAGRRLAYLQIAADLAMEPDTSGPGVGRALRYLTLDALARALGVTRRTLGRIWPDQATFRLDLLAFLLRSERATIVHALRAARREAAAAPRADPTTVLLDLGDRLHRVVGARREQLSFLAFGPHFDDVEVANRLRREHDPVLLLVRHSLELLLRTVGLQPRPGVTAKHLAAALLVVCDGTNRLLRSGLDLQHAVVSREQPGRSLTAVTLAGALSSLLVPVDTRPVVARYLRLVS